ncbi:MAG: molybdopterin-binding protein, partial [Acutalibacteraceae bacterium]
MNAEILSVGTELLLGQVINSDTAYVARSLSSVGINVHYTATVGDNPERLYQAVTDSLARCDLLVTTGGLGPTDDDLTKETVARAAGVPLAMNEDCLATLTRYFAGRYFGENQKKQAVLPVGCTVLQ